MPGDRTPDRTRRLLNRAVWGHLRGDQGSAPVRRGRAGPGRPRAGGRHGLAVGAIDETSQVKQGERTAGVKRHYLGCAGKVATIAQVSQRTAATVLADVRRQVLIGRDELVPPRLGVAALTPGEVGGEIFGVDLPPGPVEGDLVQRHAPDLDDQDGLAAVRGQRGLDDILVAWLARSLVVTSSRRGGSHASTRPVPSMPLDTTCRRNSPPGRRSPSTSP